MAPKRFYNALIRRTVLLAARLYRSALRRTAFIAVTGSLGKTTTKELITQVLASQWPGQRSLGSRNGVLAAANTVLSLRPSDRFCVQEVGINPYVPDHGISRPLAVLRPHVAVVTNVGIDHKEFFPTPEGIAEEKSKVVASLEPPGTAVLNHDDPQVLAMAGRCAGKVLTYGLSEGATVRAADIRSAWPDRLSFRLLHDGRSLEVQTQMCGAHWVSSILAAATTGLAMGIPPEAAARAVASFAPVSGRMSPETHADGVTFIRDDWKSSLPSVWPVLDFLKDARAPRKIFVLGTLIYLAAGEESQYAEIVRKARESTDFVFLVTDAAKHGLADGQSSENVRAFGSVRELSDFFRTFLEAGDLVVVKGSYIADHLERLVMARRGDVMCWASSCGRKIRCHECDFLLAPLAESPA